VQEKAAARAENKRLARDQRIVRGTANVPRSADRAEAERLIIAAAEVQVAAEAHRRHASGELDSDVVRDRAHCRKLPHQQPGHLRLECLAVTTTVTGSEGDDVGFAGYPFILRASLGDGSFAYCKTNPIPGEKAVRFEEGPQVPEECTG
jgi:hypothetical protein